uniref:Uncharacterized protein n=1 Tax=Arundo donax TaxID=35708 RepID=A0A0A9D804_ARUDO
MELPYVHIDAKEHIIFFINYIVVSKPRSLHSRLQQAQA